MRDDVWSGQGPLLEVEFKQLAAEWGTTDVTDLTRISVYWQRVDGDQRSLDEYVEWDLSEDGSMTTLDAVLRPKQPEPGLPKVTDDLDGLNKLYMWVVGHPEWYEEARIIIEIEDGRPES